MVEEAFKVLTLNCWGVFIPFCTVRKDDRLKLIAKRLSDGTYDIVMLQEIWTDPDFRMLQSSLKHVYPWSTYFHSNLIGSGLCIFSKWPMDSIFMHPFGANGYPHLLHQGDWYCGKGVGLARVTSKHGFRINLYVTHLIARYELDRTKDHYEGHRISQLIELLQFIRTTSGSVDGFIVAGDFNLESDTTAIKLFRTHLGASDAWLDNPSAGGDALESEGCTCDRADNPYRNDEWTKYYGNGERLDYIFYRTGPGPADPHSSPNLVRLSCEQCWLDLREVPDEPTGLHYSDHEGVGALFKLTRVPPSQPVETPPALVPREVEPMLLELRQQIDRGMHRCRQNRLFHAVTGVAFLLFLLLLSFNPPHYNWIGSFMSILTAGLLGSVVFVLFWGSLVGHTAERRALENGTLMVDVLLSQLEGLASNGSTKQMTNSHSQRRFPHPVKKLVKQCVWFLVS
ncbi:endonuclease/exonuclease/phosphatase family protein [Opisthorchis viverrini]|uniref:sphingomyelin phosphodiesterase n=1 Tax=Opisthorchis viverrini TaxID=6198 RepID=A0A1S8X026_OPIVI|nr:endonuclease/exonuclease/phosphatase family protein [Opisthorchis viverrini]